MNKRRVVVTGLGIVSPVGNDVPGAWASIVAGRSGIGPVERFDTSTFPTHFGGEIRQLDLAPYITTKDARRMDAFMQYGVVAGMQAMRDSGLVVTEANSDRIGVLHGFGHGRPRVDRGDLREVSGDAFAEEGVAVLHSRQHHQPGERPPVDRIQHHRPESRGSHRLHHLHACARHGHALDSIRGCGCDVGRRLGDGDLRHGHERIRTGEGAVDSATTIRKRQAALGTRIGMDSSWATGPGP